MRIASGRISLAVLIRVGLVILVCALPGLRVDAQYKEIPRKIMAFYKTSEGLSEDNNPIYNHVQLPLNNLGLVVEYFDAEATLPQVNQLDEFRGIIIWFISHEMVNAARYRAWLRQVILAGKRVVVLSGLGAYREKGESITPVDRAEVSSIYRLLGLDSNLKTRLNREASIVIKDSSFYDYEVKIRPEFVNYLWDVQSLSSKNKILLSLSEGNNEYHAAVLTSSGAFIGAGAFLKWSKDSGTPQWLIDPTRLFYHGFACSDLPVADLNTIGGNRTAFIHIDGDGFSTISKIDRWHICGQLVNDRVLKKFELPFTASVITGEIDPAYNGNSRTFKTTKEIFKHPHVEPASHGFSHPHDWRKEELSLDMGESYDFDPVMETQSSVNFIQDQLLPKGKKIELFLWTGMCNPRQSDIENVESQGWLQMNGGSGKLYDNPSISTFYPPYSQVGDRYRINSRISNEFEFTNRWLGPYDGFKNVIETIKFTGGHRPVTPANIYFHYYIMEWEEGLQSLRQVLRWIDQQPMTFVYASDYIRSVKDFMTARIYQHGSNRFKIETAGALRTIRFQNEDRGIDLANSKNILGFTKTRRDLLVHLDARETHTVVLGETERPIPHLTYANQLVDSLSLPDNSVDLAVRGYGEFRATLKGVEPNQYYEIRTVSSYWPDASNNASAIPLRAFRKVRVQFAKSDMDGRLTFSTFTKNRSNIKIIPSSSVEFAFTRSKSWLFLLIISGFIWLQMRQARTHLAFRLSRIVHNKEIRLKEFLQ